MVAHVRRKGLAMLLLLLALFLLKGRPAIGLGSLLASNRGVVGDQLVVIIGREAILIDLLGCCPCDCRTSPLMRSMSTWART
jgi:hypothetical protein